jgi:hypothetical protein
VEKAGNGEQKMISQGLLLVLTNEKNLRNYVANAPVNCLRNSAFRRLEK